MVPASAGVLLPGRGAAGSVTRVRIEHPVELLLDPLIRVPALKIGGILARKLLGFRYLMDVISLDASLIKGTHGRLPGSDAEAPVFLCSQRSLARERVAARDVRELILRLLALPARG